MATGDDALAAGMEVVAGTVPANTIDTEINLTRDYIALRTNAVTPVNKGGTGATSASGARTALDVPSMAQHNQKLTKTAAEYTNDFAYRDNQLVITNGRIDYLDNNKVGKAGDTVTGQLYFPNSTAATSSFTVAYINGDGRLSRGSSSLKYKDLLENPDLAEMGDIFPSLRLYTYKGGDGTPYLGHIAEELAENADTDRFVVRINGEIESIDFIQLLLAQTAVLNARVEALEARLSSSEE